jgi:hypothetical protein
MIGDRLLVVVLIHIESAEIVKDAWLVADDLPRGFQFTARFSGLVFFEPCDRRGNRALITSVGSIPSAARNSSPASPYFSCLSASYPLPRCCSSSSSEDGLGEDSFWVAVRPNEKVPRSKAGSRKRVLRKMRAFDTPFLAGFAFICTLS